ncbi:MAG TPA: hydroxymethylbilane synthase [Acetobacteraceae bacterium]|nr:hydroxymethylbilane synthase [Acetobacteraceae bacterium]
MIPATPPARVRTHHRDLPLRVGTRGSPLALVQTREFLDRLRGFCPVLRDMDVFREHPIRTTGDATQASGQRLTEIGGKGLFAKEIHEALAGGRIDFAVHSLKDLETALPAGIVLACTLRREDARDALILRPTSPLSAEPHGTKPDRAARSHSLLPLAGLGAKTAKVGEQSSPGEGQAGGSLQGEPDDARTNSTTPYDALPQGALVGTASVRRQAQLLHARPDLRVTTLRGNVQTRLDKLVAGACDATLLALAGLNRLGLRPTAMVVLDPELMVPAAGQGIIGVTVRADDTELRELLAGIEDPEANAVATAERALLAALDGSCRTPIGGHARVRPDGRLCLTGLVARPDGSFLLKRTMAAPAAEAVRLGAELGAALRADSPADLFA